MQIVRNALSLPLLSHQLCSSVVCISLDAILPKQILHGLPIGCSLPSITPTQAHTMWPIFWELLQTGPHRWQLQPGDAPSGVSMGFDSFRPHPTLHYELLHGYMRRSALSDALRLQGHSIFLHGPLLGCWGISLHCLHQFFLLLYWPFYLQSCFLSTFFHSPFSSAVSQFFILLNLLSQKHNWCT